MDENEERNYDFEIVLLGQSGNTGLQIEVEGAKMDNQGLRESIGDMASIDTSFSFSMSDTSGVRFSTPPLILNQPASSASSGDTLSVLVTGKTSTDTSVYNSDGFKYQWYQDGGATGPNAPNYTVSSAADYYVVVSNELGSAQSNLSVVS